MRWIGLVIAIGFLNMAEAQHGVIKGVVLAEGEKLKGATVSILGEKNH